MESLRGDGVSGAQPRRLKLRVGEAIGPPGPPRRERTGSPRTGPHWEPSAHGTLSPGCPGSPWHVPWVPRELGFARGCCHLWVLLWESCPSRGAQCPPSVPSVSLPWQCLHTWYLEGGGQRGHQTGPGATPLPGVTGWVSHAWGRLRNGPSTSGVLVLCLPAPQPHKTSPRGCCGKTRVHYGDVTFSRSHIWAGHPCSYHCHPKKSGGCGMQKTALFCGKTVSSSAVVP